MKIARLIDWVRGDKPVDHRQDVDDQTYAEAMMDNAVVNSQHNVKRSAQIKEAAENINEKLSNGIARMRIVSADKGKIMDSLVRGMKSGKN